MWLVYAILGSNAMLYLEVAALVVAALILIWLTRSVKAVAFLVLAAAPLLATQYYARSLIAIGTAQCMSAVMDANAATERDAKDKIEKQRTADANRIAELEMANRELQARADQRAAVRDGIPLSEACERCRVPRAWMRAKE